MSEITRYRVRGRDWRFDKNSVCGDWVKFSDVQQLQAAHAEEVAERAMENAALRNEVATANLKWIDAKAEAKDRDSVLAKVCWSLDELRDCINSAPAGWRKNQCLEALGRIAAVTVGPANELAARDQTIAELRERLDVLRCPDGDAGASHQAAGRKRAPAFTTRRN